MYLTISHICSKRKVKINYFFLYFLKLKYFMCFARPTVAYKLLSTKISYFLRCCCSYRIIFSIQPFQAGLHLEVHQFIITLTPLKIFAQPSMLTNLDDHKMFLVKGVKKINKNLGMKTVSERIRGSYSVTRCHHKMSPFIKCSCRYTKPMQLLLVS